MSQTFATFPTSCLLPREPREIELKKQLKKQLMMQALIEPQCVPSREADTVGCAVAVGSEAQRAWRTFPRVR